MSADRFAVRTSKAMSTRRGQQPLHRSFPSMRAMSSIAREPIYAACEHSSISDPPRVPPGAAEGPSRSDRRSTRVPDGSDRPLPR